MLMIQPNADWHLPWFAVLQGLAGASPAAYWHNMSASEFTELLERAKQESSEWRGAYKEPMGAAFRAPYWLMHAYAHWVRAWECVGQWDADLFDEEFPHGLGFRRYLGAWMHAVGVPQLGMAPKDIEAVHQMTGVAVMPHELLPVGLSMFRHPAEIEWVAACN